MSIKFACSCGKAYKVPEKFAGKRVKCKQCDETIRVPSESEASVTSSRASAVSKRSVLASQRVPSKDGAPGASARVERRKGSGTARFEAVDLKDELKTFARKRKEEEEFAKGQGRVTYFSNGKPAKAFRLGKDDVTIGRDEGCSVALEVASVSKEHLKIEYKLGTFIATDLQSLNGVTVNGKVVRRASLKDGDIVQLGEAVLRVDCG